MVTFPNVAFTLSGDAGAGSGSDNYFLYGGSLAFFTLAPVAGHFNIAWRVRREDGTVAYSSAEDTGGFVVTVTESFTGVTLGGFRGSVSYPIIWDDDPAQGTGSFTVEVVSTRLSDGGVRSWIATFARPHIDVASDLALRRYYGDVEIDKTQFRATSYPLPDWRVFGEPKPKAPAIVAFEVDWREGSFQTLTAAANTETLLPLGIGPVGYIREAQALSDPGHSYPVGREYAPVTYVRAVDDLGRRGDWFPMPTRTLLLARVGLATDAAGVLVTCEGHYDEAEDYDGDLWIRSNVAGEFDSLAQNRKIGTVANAWYPTLIYDAAGDHLLLTNVRGTEETPEHWQLWRSRDYGETWDITMTLPTNADEYAALTMCPLWEGGVAMVGIKKSDGGTLAYALTRDYTHWTGFTDHAFIDFPRVVTVYQESVAGRARIVVTNGINTILEFPNDLDH